MRAGAGERLHGFGLGGARSRNHQQPERIAAQGMGRGCRQHGVERVDVVAVAKPFAEYRVDLGQDIWRVGQIVGRILAFGKILGDRRL